MLQAASGLVPTRFLTLISHFVMAMTVMMAREDNVLACLPLEYTDIMFNRKDTELAAGLGVTIGLLAIEMVKHKTNKNDNKQGCNYSTTTFIFLFCQMESI